MAFKIDKVSEIPEKCLDNDTHLYIKEDGTLSKISIKYFGEDLTKE